MATGVRVGITLACTECKRRNYQTNKSKRNTPDRFELKKFCRWCKSAHPAPGDPLADGQTLPHPPRQASSDDFQAPGTACAHPRPQQRAQQVRPTEQHQEPDRRAA